MAQSVSVECSILKALENATACTNETLLSIKGLLSPSPDTKRGSSCQSGVRKGAGHGRAKSLVSTAKVTKEAGKTKAHTRPLAVVEIKAETVLDEQEKVNFAFQVVNGCIQTLSRLAKEHVLSKRSVTTVSTVVTTKRGKAQPVETALRPKSPNARRFKAIDEVCKASSKPPMAAAMIAACASSALAYLQMHYKVSNGKDTTFQVVTGALAVISKCIDLELAVLATEQLQVVRAWVIEHTGAEMNAQTAKSQNVGAFQSLLEFPASVANSSMLQFAVKVQQHVWQLVNAQANAQIIDVLAATDHVQCKLLRSYAAELEDGAKVSKQVTVMSRLFLQISTAQKVSAEALLRLRCSAFALHVFAAELAGGLSEQDAMGISTKLSRCIETFLASSKLTSLAKRNLAEVTIASLLGSLHSYPVCAADLSSLRKSLTQLTGEAGNENDGAQLLRMVAENSDTSLDAIRRAASGMCSADSQKLLEHAAVALRRPLPSDKPAADRLLVEVVGLRRALHKTVLEQKLDGCQSLTVVTGCLEYLRQYLEHPLVRKSREDSLREERFRLGRKFIKPFISTVIVCCLHHKSPSLETIAGLDACFHIFCKVLEHDADFAEERFNDSKDPTNSIFVTISRLCYKIWNTHSSIQGSADDVALAALVASIKVMQPWTIAEKEAVALTAKLRYLMEAHMARDEWQEAFLTFGRLLSEYKLAGYLREIGDAAAMQSPQTLREPGSMGAILFRCIQSWVTLMRQRDFEEEQITLGTFELEFNVQGLLLEWQLGQLAVYAAQQRKIDSKSRYLVQVTKGRLLELYERNNYPVRRLRVGLTIARLLPSMTQLYRPQELLEAVSIPPRPRNHGYDTAFQSQAPYLQAKLSADLALLDPHGDSTIEALHASLETYSAISTAATSDAQQLRQMFCDIEAWVEHVVAIADLFAARRDAAAEAKALETVVRVLVHAQQYTERKAKVLCRLAGLYLIMGYTSKADGILQIAGGDLKAGKASVGTHIDWLLGKAEWHLAMSEHDKSKAAFEQASQRAVDGGENSFVQKTFSPTSATLNVDDRRLVARAAYLNALLKFQEGHAGPALRLCSIAKCMLFKVWSSIEQIMPSEPSMGTSMHSDSRANSDRPSEISGHRPMTTTRLYSYLSSPQLRVLVPDLFKLALLEVKIHDFRGAYHDAFAALKHINKIANFVGAGIACISDTAAADLYVRSVPLNSQSLREEKVRSARRRIDMVDATSLESTSIENMLEHDRTKAAILAAEGEPEEQVRTLQSSLEKLQLILSKGLGKSDFPSMAQLVASRVDDVADQLSSMSLDKQKKPGRKTATVKKASRSAPKITAREVKQEQEVVPCMRMETWQSQLLREVSSATLTNQSEPDLDEISEFIEKAGVAVHDARAAVQQGITASQLLTYQALGKIEADITFNALHDCILSIPGPLGHQQGKEQPRPVPAKTPRKGKIVKNPPPKATASSGPPFLDLLSQGFDSMQQTWPSSCSISSVATLRYQGQLMSSISATVSACSIGQTPDAAHPLVLAYHNDMPPIRSTLLNRNVEHPSVEKLQKDDLKSWPTTDPNVTAQQTCSHLDRASFQQQYIDILPESWNVVSMSLADDKTCLKLIRYRSGQSPFCLRIPFAHRDSDDVDEEILDISLAYERLRVIMRQHQFTPVEEGVTDQADFKKQWWQKKHELDMELRVLLQDVEQQWFSAVKGIFYSQPCDRQNLANILAQLQSIITQHCPSTKKGKSKGKSTKDDFKLELRIVELFVGLGNPDNEVEEVGEDGLIVQQAADTAAMADGIDELVRLILESLQFSGESVAIDEVDMDSIIVKVIDALREYHSTRSDLDCAASHTVLILDNQLHGFPWESLPCLRNRSVSRLASLEELRDRIISARSCSKGEKFSGRIVCRTSGTSLLNPSGDLKKTAQRFQPWLGKLPANWAHLRKAPDDEGWRDLLAENEIFLYVGHGSTSQYIRPHVVKRLGYNTPNERSGLTCAVSWLIGCSSAAVEDLGSFEPNGMVLSYLAAGSPAVLGALWDVGDIDADHFSITAGDYWGLWDESNKGLDPKLFPARKKISEEKKVLGRQMSMCEAVARSRGGCKLPYLNGAAFVVYGIPVFLD